MPFFSINFYPVIHLASPIYC